MNQQKGLVKMVDRPKKPIFIVIVYINAEKLDEAKSWNDKQSLGADIQVVALDNRKSGTLRQQRRRMRAGGLPRVHASGCHLRDLNTIEIILDYLVEYPRDIAGAAGKNTAKQPAPVRKGPGVAQVSCTQTVIRIGDEYMDELVSIIIPCYNHERYLDSCMKSVICQSYHSIELLICDDCSPDNSFERLLSWKEALESRFERVEIVRNETNQGVCKTLNRLLRLARGKYIKALASDDMLLPDGIENYVTFAQTHTFDILFSNALIVGERSQYPISDTRSLSKYYSEIPPHGRNLTSKLYLGNFILGASLFVPRETFEKFGQYNESYTFEDWEFCLRVSVDGCIEYLDQATGYYRRVEGSLSHYKRNDEGRRLFRKIYAESKRLFADYCPDATDAEKGKFYNAMLNAAILVNDTELIRSILSELKNAASGISLGNMARLVTNQLGVYNILRGVKRRFIKKII